MNQDRVIESFYPDGSLITAGPGRRFGGMLLDVLISAFTLWIGWFIWFIIVAPNGQTPGKQLLGMYVMKADGSRAGGSTIWMREVLLKIIALTVLSWMTAGIFPLIAALWCLWDRNVQCLWDKMASTYVAWSPRGYKPLTDQELRMTGQSLRRYTPAPQQAQAYPTTIVPPPKAQPPFGQPFEPPVQSPFAQPSSPQGSSPAASVPAVSKPPVESPVVLEPTPGYAQPVSSPFGEPAAPLAMPPASTTAPPLAPADEYAHPVSSPFAEPVMAADVPLESALQDPGGVPPVAHPVASPFAQQAEWLDPAQGSPGGDDASRSPFDFSDDPTFKQDPFAGPAMSVADRLRDLARLRDQGLVTEDEYQSRRQKLLDEL